MPEPVNIPVQVTGAEQAKAELRALGATVDQTGRVSQPGRGRLTGEAWVQQQAAGKLGAETAAAEAAAKDTAAGAQDRLNAATNQGIFAHEGYSRASKAMIVNLLGMVNPALGQTAFLMSQVFHGLTRMTGTMLGIAGGAVALGVVVAVFQRMAEAAKRAQEAIERAREAWHKAREEGAGQREKLAAEAGKAGIWGDTTAIQQAVNAAQAERGEPPELAASAEIASRLAARGGMGFDRGRYMAGIMAFGGEAPKFGGKPGANLALIRRVQTAGQAPEAQQAWRSYLAEQAEYQRGEAPPQATEETTTVDAVMKSLGKNRPDLTKEELTGIDRMVREKVLARQPKDLPEPQRERLAGRLAVKLGITKPSWVDRILRGVGVVGTGAGPAFETLPAGLGGKETTLDLLDLARQVEGDVGRISGGQVEPRAPTTQPVQLIVNHYETTTHIATNYGSMPPTRSPSVLSPDGF